MNDKLQYGFEVSCVKTGPGAMETELRKFLIITLYIQMMLFCCGSKFNVLSLSPQLRYLGYQDLYINRLNKINNIFCFSSAGS